MISPLIDIPLQHPSQIFPFFHAELPLIAPGINASYMPATDENGKATIVHTEIAESFLEKAMWYLRDQHSIKFFDARVFHAISVAKEKIPMEVTIRLHLRTLWQKDIDGPDKIIIDALFKHFKFLADPGQEKNWNDNRVIRLIVEKDVALSGIASIEIEVRCVVSGK